MMLSFIIATCIISLMPGPSMILVMTNSIQKDFLSGIKTIFGVIFADAILLILTLSGIGTIIYTSALIFTALKWLGVIYLIYLGVKQLRSDVEEDSNKKNIARNPFFQGFGTTMLNPKIIGFFMAFFPQFLNHKESIINQLMVLGPLFLLIVFVIMFFYALFATSLGGIIETQKGKAIIKNASGFSLIGCGLFAATMEKS